MTVTTKLDKHGTYNNRAKKRHMTFQVIRQIILISAVVVTLGPFLWMLITSLKVKEDILAYPPKLLPIPLSFQNYLDVLTSADFPRYILNSAIVAFSTVILTLFVSIHAGYAAARYEFPGKDFIMFLILAGMAIGRFANVIPLYFMATRLGMLDTYLILIIAYSAFITPLTSWLMQGYYRTIPRQLEEAAAIDGCSRLSAFYRVVVPVTKPAMVASAVIAMVHAWNEFILALVMTSSDQMRTLPVGLHFFLTYYGVDWGSLTAGAMISVIPIVIVFLILQRYFIQGLTSGMLGSA